MNDGTHLLRQRSPEWVLGLRSTGFSVRSSCGYSRCLRVGCSSSGCKMAKNEKTTTCTCHTLTWDTACMSVPGVRGGHFSDGILNRAADRLCRHSARSLELRLSKLAVISPSSASPESHGACANEALTDVQMLSSMLASSIITFALSVDLPSCL